MFFLVCNVGSTSLKFKLFHMPSEEIFTEAKISAIGADIPSEISYQDKAGHHYKNETLFVSSYTEGIRIFLDLLDISPLSATIHASDISCVCFKTVLAKFLWYPRTDR